MIGDVCWNDQRVWFDQPLISGKNNIQDGPFFVGSMFYKLVKLQIMNKTIKTCFGSNGQIRVETFGAIQITDEYGITIYFANVVVESWVIIRVTSRSWGVINTINLEAFVLYSTQLGRRYRCRYVGFPDSNWFVTKDKYSSATAIFSILPVRSRGNIIVGKLMGNLFLG